MEPDAIGRWLDRLGASLVLFARQRCDAPEDVVQDAFVRLSELDPPPGNVPAWLFRVVRNLAFDAAKSSGRRRRHESRVAIPPDAWFDAEGADPDAPDPAEIGRALEALPVDEREVVVAHLWGGLTFRQIGEALGTSSSSAHRLYARGLETLKERWGTPCRQDRRNPS